MSNINLNNVTQSGSTTLFSGISSGINSQATIDAIISAKRAPAVLIEKKIDVNNQKITDLNTLRDLSTTFKDTLDLLRGPTSSTSTDIFKQKVAYSESFLTSASTNTVASAAESILGTSVTSDAVEGSYTVEVRQIAEAQQIRSDAFTSTTTDLTTLGYTAGTFSINGQNVTVAVGDTLLDLQDKINALDAGATPTNVVASIISVSATENYLTLTSTETGTANAITLAGDTTVTDSLGLTALGAVKNEINAAADAIIRVNNLGVDITRSTNAIDDVIEGVTLNLFKAEQETEIKIDIESDKNSIKTAISDFVNAYNDIRAFVKDQRSEQVRVDGEDPEFGSLAFDGTLRRVSEKLSELISTPVRGIDPASGFASISQIGLTIDANFDLTLEDGTFDNALLTNLDGVRKLFTFDFSSSDSRVKYFKSTGNPVNAVDGSGVVTPYYLNMGGTDATGNIISANLSDTAGAGSLSDGTIVIERNLMKVDSPSSADGLELLYIGNPNDLATLDVNVSFTRGVADTMFSFFDGMVGDTTDAIDSAISSIEQQNVDYNDDITTIDDRLEITRKNLNARFLAMEVAMSRINSLKDTLSQYADSLNGGNGG